LLKAASDRRKEIQKGKPSLRSSGLCVAFLGAGCCVAVADWHAEPSFHRPESLPLPAWMGEDGFR